MKIVYHYANLPKPAIYPKISTVKNEFIKVQTVKVIDKEKEIYEVAEEYKVNKSIDTDKLAQSFAGTTGVESIIKKVAITGDESLLNTIQKDSFVDITKAPSTIHEAQALIRKGQIAFDKLDPALKGDATDANELLSNLSIEKIKDYINSVVESRFKKKSEVKDSE